MSADKEVFSLLAELRRVGGKISYDGSALKIRAPKRGMPPRLRARLQESKPGLIAFFQARGAQSPRDVEIARVADTPVLSFAQQRLWVIEHLEGASAAHVEGGGLRLAGPLDVDALQRALEALVARHQSLRVAFPARDGEAFIHPLPPYNPLQRCDLGELDDGRDDPQLQAFLRQRHWAPFDLADGPLWRVTLVRRAAQDHLLLVAMHHIICDAWSFAILVRELMQCYRACCAGREPALPPLAIDYSDYAHWQRRWLAGARLERELAYWREQLDHAPPVLALPIDRPRPARQSYRGASVRLTLDRDLTSRLQQFSQARGATPFMTLISALGVLLSRYCDQRDLCIGTPIANRTQSQTEAVIGFFVNTLVIRQRIDEDENFCVALARAKETALGAYAHQQIPFEQLVSRLEVARSLSHSPLFQVMFVLQNAPLEELRLDGVGVSPLSAEALGREVTAKYDLTLEVAERNGELDCRWEYASDLFDGETVARMARHYRQLLRGLLARPQCALREISMLPAAEQERIVQRWNATASTDNGNHCIHELFEAQVARDPRALALVFEQQRLSYGDLNRRANQLAHHLITLGVKPDTLVAICLQRSPEMVIALLAVLKAGGAYLPLDASYPPARLQHMLDDSEAELLLTHTGLENVLPESATRRVLLDDASLAAQLGACPQTNPSRADLRLNSRHLAYAVYTSGSTGLPKASLLAHRGLCNLARCQRQRFAVDAASRVLQFASFAFDAATSEWAMALTAGAALVLIPPRAVSSAALLQEQARRHRVTHATLPPALLPQLHPQAWSHLTTLIVAGDQCPRALAEAWSVGRRFYNAYGPSETTVCATIGAYRPGQAHLHMGRPIANTRVYVLDPHGAPLPVGIAGELYIGGVGVARGYHRRPRLTAERFVDDPFSDDAAARLYRSGDRVRWLADGNLEFLGRVDTQVKIRGFRVELGEIEHALRGHRRVGEAVVLAVDDGGGQKCLQAYLVEDGEGEPATLIEDLRRHLQERLPDHMLPAAYTVLDRLPLTPNGKLDRAALPAPDVGRQRGVYVAPRDERERVLCQIWQDLLHLDRVGVDDNFFHLGGHSLLVIQFVSRLQAAGLQVDPRAVFSAPTIAELAATLQRQGPEAAPPAAAIPSDCERILPSMVPLVALTEEHLQQIASQVPGGAGNIQDIYPLAPLQEGILFHHLMHEDSDAYVLPWLVGMHNRAAAERLIDALRVVVMRHDALRTLIFWRDLPVAVQVVQRRAELALEALTLTPERDTLAQLQALVEPSARHRMELSRAALVLQVAEDAHSPRCYLLFKFHHIVFDHIGFEIIAREIEAIAAGRAAQLPAPAPYRAFVAQALERAREHDGQQYFRARLGDVEEVTAPFGLTDTRGDGGRVAEAMRPLAPPLACAIRASARRLALSPASLFHAAFAALVSATSGRDDVVFGTVLSGRLQGGRDSGRMLGLFINTLPMRVKLAGLSVAALVAAVHEELMTLLRYEQTPLAVAQNCSALSGGAPLFSALLNYRHSTPTADSGGAIPALAMEYLGGQERTNYPLTVSVDDFGEDFALTAQSDRAVDPARVLAYMEVALRNLLRALEQATDNDVAAIAILPDDEWRQVVRAWNDTDAPFARAKCVHQVFEARAARRPRACALVCYGRQLTYGELNGRANRLAHYLLERGVSPDELVGICVARSPAMLVGILAILKAGGAYLPLDPDAPRERLRYMLEDASVRLVLTDSRLAERLPLAAERQVHLDGPAAPALDDHAETDIDGRRQPVGPSNLVYAMYTSGSTGHPKGVLIEHHSVTSLVLGGDYVDLCSHTRMLQNAPLTFDAATFEIWGALLNGGTVVMQPAALIDTAALGDFIRANRVTTAWMTAGLFDQFSSFYRQPMPDLEYLLVGGDVVSPQAVARVKAGNPGLDVINGYGPTEATTFSCAYLIPDHQQGKIPIGRPLANRRAYVLDPRGQPCAVGAPGELYVGGEGVARAYLNRPRLTAERFVPDPFSEDPDARLYRTGDLVYWRPDGHLAFIGRRDQQVKIRGFRIELGEVESVLTSHSAIREAVVVVRADADGRRRLVAYLVGADAGGNGEAEWLVAQARDVLAARLPDYMMPALFMAVPELPLTPNGKVDRNALPRPDIDRRIARGYVAPRTPIERELCRLWQSVLGLSKVGVEDNFFDLGGDSILAIQIVARANQAGLVLNTGQLMAHQCIARLAAAVEPASAPVVSHAAVRGRQELLPVQQWFFHHDPAHLEHFNQDMLLLAPAALDKARLEQLFRALIERHDVLRLCYRRDDEGRWAGHYQDSDDAWWKRALVCEHLPVVGDDGSSAPGEGQLNDRCRYHQAQFRLSEGPLWRAVLYLGGERPYLHVILHHLIVDGISWRILLEDIEQAYHRRERGDGAGLAPKTASYQDWALLLGRYAHSASLRAERDYWLRELGRPQDSLPLADIAPRGTYGACRQVAVRWSGEETRVLLTEAPRAYKTQINEVLLASLWLALHRWSGGRHFNIDMEGHGRETLGESLDLSGTVGWFTSIYPLHLACELEAKGGATDLATLIAACKKTLRAVPNKGMGFGVLRYMSEDREIIRAAEANAATISFNYLGRFGQARPADAVFSPLRFNSEQVVATDYRLSHRLSVNGIIENEALAFSIAYCPVHSDNEAVQDLGRQWRQALLDILQHCREKNRRPLPAAEDARGALPRMVKIPCDSMLNYQVKREGWGTHFNVHVDLSYKRSETNVDALKLAIKKVIRDHDGCRVRIHEENGVYSQYLADGDPLDIEDIDLTGFSEHEQITRMQAVARELQKTFVFHRDAPLYKITHFVLSDAHPCYIFLLLHHFVFDGVSRALIAAKIAAYYQRIVADESWYERRENTVSILDWRAYKRARIERCADADLRYLAAFDFSRLCRFDAHNQAANIRTQAQVEAFADPRFALLGESLAETSDAVVMCRLLSRDDALTLCSLLDCEGQSVFYDIIILSLHEALAPLMRGDIFSIESIASNRSNFAELIGNTLTHNIHLVTTDALLGASVAEKIKALKAAREAFPSAGMGVIDYLYGDLNGEDDGRRQALNGFRFPDVGVNIMMSQFDAEPTFFASNNPDICWGAEWCRDRDNADIKPFFFHIASAHDGLQALTLYRDGCVERDTALWVNKVFAWRLKKNIAGLLAMSQA